MSNVTNDDTAEVNICCSFCETSKHSTRESLRDHSIRCLTDIDDLLLITYKPDTQFRSKYAMRRHAIYPNHSTVDEALYSINKELQDRPYNCTECDWAGKNITVLNDHVNQRHFGLQYPCEEYNYVAMTKRKLQIHKQEFGFQNV